VLRLLLDAHISPSVAREVCRHRPECEIVALRDWRAGEFLDEPDDGVILEWALADRLAPVTRDVSSISPLLVDWGLSGKEHAGIIFVDDRTIAERDIKGLVRAVVELWDEERSTDWQNRVHFLRRPRGSNDAPVSDTNKPGKP
jgi:hypothetical protein